MAAANPPAEPPVSTQSESAPSIVTSGHSLPATYQSGSTFKVVSVSILIMIGFVTHLGLSLALFASMGAIVMLAGNGILNQTSKNNTSAASIGVVGSLILYPPLCLLYLLVPTSPGVPRYKHFDSKLIATVIPSFIISALTGVIGSAVLLKHHVDLGGIDIKNALLAGGIAGFIFAIAGWVFHLSPFCLLSSILSPIWLAIMDQWEHVKRTENGTDRSHSHSYGSGGDDPEIIAEMQNLPGRD